MGEVMIVTERHFFQFLSLAAHHHIDLIGFQLWVEIEKALPDALASLALDHGLIAENLRYVRRDVDARVERLDALKVIFGLRPVARAMLLPLGLHERFRRHQTEVLSNGLDRNGRFVAAVSRVRTQRVRRAVHLELARPQAMHDEAERVLALEQRCRVRLAATAERRRPGETQPEIIDRTVDVAKFSAALRVIVVVVRGVVRRPGTGVDGGGGAGGCPARTTNEIDDGSDDRQHEEADKQRDDQAACAIIRHVLC